jgi:hypothetical protein
MAAMFVVTGNIGVTAKAVRVTILFAWRDKAE